MDYTKYCAITYNGKLIDELLPGYETINVEGRGLLAPTLDAIDIDGRDGDYVIGQKYRPRDLKVYFLVRTNNNKERLDIVNRLDVMLRTKEDVVFSFGDQEGYWIGRYSGEQDLVYDYFNGQGHYILHCQNPYRHMPLITYSTSPATVNADIYKKLELEELTATVSSTTEVQVLNSRTGDVIRLTNLPSLGELVINRKEITLDGQNIVNLLDESVSTWKGFEIESGDTISVTGATSPTINIRRYL